MTPQQKVVSQILSGKETPHNKLDFLEAKWYANQLAQEVYLNWNNQPVKCYACNKRVTTNPSGICDECL